MFATPIIRPLRRRFPDAHIAWVVEPAARDVVEHHPDLDEVVVWDRPKWKKLLKSRRFGELRREFTSFRDHLRSRRFDLALDMQGLSRSGLVALVSGARVRIGLGSREGTSAIMHQRLPTGLTPGEMSGESRVLAEWLGLDTSGWGMDLRLAPGTRERAREKLAAAGVDGPFILMVPFTTRDWKHWVESRWGPMAVRLREDFGLPVVMTGGPADRPAADRILTQAGDAVTDLVGRTSLGEAMGVVAEAALVIGVDTGLTHAAHAFRRPAICMFGPSGYSFPPTPMTRMVRHHLTCTPCHSLGTGPTCGGAFTCMDLISQREIVSRARELLDAYPPGARRTA
jgi:heptosyltransferase-1